MMLGRMTLGRMTLGRMTLGRMILGRMTLGRMPFRVMALLNQNIMCNTQNNKKTLTQCYAELI